MPALFAIGVGVALGCASSLLPGPCNLAIVDGAVRRASTMRLLATGLGGALGDLVYATIGAAGAGALLARYPHLLVVFQAITGLVLLVLGGARLVPGAALARATRTLHGSLGVSLGLGLVIANPSVLATWILVVGALAGAGSGVDREIVAVAIAAGSFAGFAIVGQLARRAVAVRTLSRLAPALGLVLVVLGVLALVRAVAGVARIA